MKATVGLGMGTDIVSVIFAELELRRFRRRRTIPHHYSLTSFGWTNLFVRDFFIIIVMHGYIIMATSFGF